MNDADLTEEQKNYLHGFVAGSGVLQLLPTFAGTLGLSLHGAGIGSASASGAAAAATLTCPEAIHFQAQDQQTAAGGKLVPEEVAKRKRFPLDQWDDLARHAAEGRFPKGTDVLAFKYQGLFYVAPAQDAYMCRLRFAGGILPSFQLRRVADIAESWGGGYADVTTRSNLQVRQIKAQDAVRVVEALHEAGIVNRGSGADNIRNITGCPTAGIDPQELYDTRPLSQQMHHYILNHREMYGLPRKFNIAFDGGGTISAVEDTNDIGFSAVRVGEGKIDADGKPVAPGVYFRMALGGITGHQDFARDSGLLLTADECVPVAAAVVRVFIAEGDRTDRKKARLKYVLDRWGHAKFIVETERLMPAPLRRLGLEQCEPRLPVDKHGHIGFHPQSPAGFWYVGVTLPVGRMRVDQMRGLADIADRHGSGSIRLTVWQNLLISDIPAERIDAVKAEIETLGLGYSATSVRAGLVACTGAAGCKYAAAHTKQHAMEAAAYLEPRLKLDAAVNIHFTGCHHSCAQHYMGDLGMLGTQVEVGDDLVEGYHVFVGGGYGAEQGVGREVFHGVPATDVPLLFERILRSYLEHRNAPDQTFREFIRRHSSEQLALLFEEPAVTS